MLEIHSCQAAAVNVLMKDYPDGSLILFLSPQKLTDLLSILSIFCFYFKLNKNVFFPTTFGTPTYYDINIVDKQQPAGPVSFKHVDIYLFIYCTLTLNHRGLNPFFNLWLNQPLKVLRFIQSQPADCRYLINECILSMFHSINTATSGALWQWVPKY